MATGRGRVRLQARRGRSSFVLRLSPESAELTAARLREDGWSVEVTPEDDEDDSEPIPRVPPD
jgi:hypothetical protein